MSRSTGISYEMQTNQIDSMVTIQIDDFNLEATLESGQVFGFARNRDGTYEGSIYGRNVKVSQENGVLAVGGNSSGPIVRTSAQLDQLVRRYFDLERDLTPVYELLCADDRLKPIYEQCKGLRVIRQDPWEALACFIISSNNNIKRIQLIRRNLAQAFCGSQFEFPKARAIAGSNERTLRALGLGYRAPFLCEAARIVATWRQLLDEIRGADYEEAKAQLMDFPGIGEKVADCVLLFGFQKYEAFPVDVWIYRAIKKLYFKNRRVSEKKVREFAQRRWGRYAGYVQQYLYHGARHGLLEGCPPITL